MQRSYYFNIVTPNFYHMGYIKAIAKTNDKHDRSAPTDFHWKILKCRMIIFSTSSILACPDKNDVKEIHIIYNRHGDDYCQLSSLFMKYSLIEAGPIEIPTPEMFSACFQYTMTATIAPLWNTVGCDYLINNRNFLTSYDPQDGIKYKILTNGNFICVELKPVKIKFMKTTDTLIPGKWVRVLPSLNKAVIEDSHESLPKDGNFKTYKDLRRHWKNIHGYRLPIEESPYYNIKFWRGDPLTYPKICIVKNHPVITPIPKQAEKIVLSRFLDDVKKKMPRVLGIVLEFEEEIYEDDVHKDHGPVAKTGIEAQLASQAVSLCTPTQAVRKGRFNFK